MPGRNIGTRRLDNPRNRDILAPEGIFLDAASPIEVQKHFENALLHTAQGRVDEAIAELREVTRALPDYAPAHGRLGVLLAEKGLSKEAVVEFQAALGADPADSGAQFQLAMLQDKLDHRADALSAFEGFLAAAGAGGTEHAEFARRRSAELRKLLGMRPSPGSRLPDETKEDRGGGFAFLRGDGDKRSLSGAVAFLRGWVQGLWGLSWGPGALLVGGGLVGAAAIIGMMGRGAPAPVQQPASRPGFPGTREIDVPGSRPGGRGSASEAPTSSIELLERANAKPAQAEAPAPPAQAAPSVDANAPEGAGPKAAVPAARRAASSPGADRPQLQGGGAWQGIGRSFKGGFRDPRAARGAGARGAGGPSGTVLRDLAAPLKNKRVGDRNVTANKAMGQLKFAGKQSAKSLAAGSSAGAAVLTDDAFTQQESGAQGVKSRGCSRSRRAVAGDMLTTKTGCQGGDEEGWAPGKAGGCPEGMAPAPGGGCRPVGKLQGENVTTYQKDVDRAKSLSDEASRLTNDSNPITRELNRKKAKALSEQASALGKKIDTASGQKDQGQLIEDVSDQSNEKSNISAGAARARQTERKLDKTLKNSKGDDDANTESAAGYR